MGRKSFDAEMHVLEYIRLTQHPYLVQYVAAWFQDDVGYILFPCASTTLADEFQRSTTPINACSAIELLENLAHITSALEKLHDATLLPTKPMKDQHSPFPSKQQYVTFLHLDLKAENILIFQKSSERTTEWKIGDFGSADTYCFVAGDEADAQSQAAKYESESMGGDYSRAPPDSQSYGYVTKAYDVWSLGCLFLEILLWKTSGSAWSREDFAFDRLQSPDVSPSGNYDDSFWYKDGSTASLKPVVSQSLHTLPQRVDKIAWLTNVVDVTNNMLSIDPEERPPAALISERLSLAREQLRQPGSV